MAGERRVVALRQAEIGLRQRHRDGNEQRVRAQVAGLAAIDQAGAAQIVERSSGRIHVDLAKVNVQVLHAFGEREQILGGEAGELLLHIFVQLVLRVLGGLVDVAALGDQLRLRRS